VSRRARRLLVAAVIAALVTPLAAGASLSLRGIDTSGYPRLRVTVVSPVASTAAPPTLTENGNRVVGLHAVNLAATKSVVIAIDRSRSMSGTKLADALDVGAVGEDLDPQIEPHRHRSSSLEPGPGVRRAASRGPPKRTNGPRSKG